MTGPHDAANVLETLVGERYSCRAFLPEPVPQELVVRMFAMAQQTASWCNAQAWRVELVSGDAIHSLADALTASASTGVEAFDLAPPSSYDGIYLERRRASGFGLYNAVGVARGDLPGRVRQTLENFRFFGAPHTAIISTPKSFGAYGAVDCGGYISGLLLAAQSLGIASIAQAAIAGQAALVHDILGIPQDSDIVCAVSFGFADTAHPANSFRTDRAAISDVVHPVTEVPAGWSH